MGLGKAKRCDLGGGLTKMRKGRLEWLALSHKNIREREGVDLPLTVHFYFLCDLDSIHFHLCS